MLLSRWAILERIGSGGFGSIFKGMRLFSFSSSPVFFFYHSYMMRYTKHVLSKPSIYSHTTRGNGRVSVYVSVFGLSDLQMPLPSF